MRQLALLAMVAAVCAACGAPDGAGSSAEEDALVVYSSRNDQLIRPIFERYEEVTGESIRYLTDADGALIARLEAEGRRTPADILMTVDAGNLWRAADLDLLQPLNSDAIAAAIPEAYRDSEGRWTGLSLRTRTIVHSTQRVAADELSSYEALADEQWRGRLCLRTSKKVYNQSLVASMIERLGQSRTEEIVRGWVANLAQAPHANDTAVIEAIASGNCDVGIVNSYYFGRMQRDRPDLPVALFWANQAEGSSGAHVNVSGAGITRHARQPERARALLEWLSEGEGQALFARLNLEYPANPNIEAADTVRAWGDFRPDDMRVERLGALQRQAVQLMDRAGYR